MLQRRNVHQWTTHQDQDMEEVTSNNTRTTTTTTTTTADAQALAMLRGSGCGKGRGKSGSSRQQRPAPAEGCEGTIKMFNGGKGFGFISYPGGEVFVHCSDCHGEPPMEGAPVSFDVVEDPRTGKMKAVNAICAAPRARP